MQHRVVVIDADERLTDRLCAQLTKDGYQAVPAHSLEHARVQATAHKPAALVLGDSGGRPGAELALLRRLRAGEKETGFDQASAVVVIGEPSDLELARAFDAGCDDYVAKPVSYIELRARLGAALEPDRRRPQTLRLGALEIYLAARTATHAGRPIELSALEFDLLARLARTPTAVVSKTDLLRRVWGYDNTDGVRTRTVDAHACRLRAKLRAAGADLVWVCRGRGYSLLAPGRQPDELAA